jgi:hypothetical protein
MIHCKMLNFEKKTLLEVNCDVLFSKSSLSKFYETQDKEKQSLIFQKL